MYCNLLRVAPGWEVPFCEANEHSSGHLMVAIAPSPEARASVASKLREAGIQTSMHYPCVSDFAAFREWQTEIVQVTRDFTLRAITLPLFPTMSETQVQEICTLIQNAD